ncbi:hypothetical protein NZ47_13160 [Anaerovibrio lipolyticus]|uniref:Uncharacterized protein n=2 Tax=Anaerovibrio lipolyticus TaxID=82374 RepID=A0A0B2JKW3_9FIRM|nr:hypothetical protein [Anaerovibrio lipolyticus]KHM48449.1 hypothetical protein NZ47_13160 [Anaerovibrio lipolyticus]
MENKKMNIDEMDKVSGGNAGNIGQGDLDILTPKDIDIKITKPNNDGKVPSPKLGEKDPTIIGDPTQGMIK